MSSAPTQNPATLWDHDRRLIANWLLREASAGFDGAEVRGDGSSFIQITADFGAVSVSDYWSFARHDFDLSQRQQSYQDILRRQAPILAFGYQRAGAGDSQLVVFLNGEINTGQGFAESFAPFTQGKQPGELVAIETLAGGGQNLVELYTDTFLQTVLEAVRQRAHRPPALFQ